MYRRKATGTKNIASFRRWTRWRSRLFVERSAQGQAKSDFLQPDFWRRGVKKRFHCTQPGSAVGPLRSRPLSAVRLCVLHFVGGFQLTPFVHAFRRDGLPNLAPLGGLDSRLFCATQAKVSGFGPDFQGPDSRFYFLEFSNI